MSQTSRHAHKWLCQKEHFLFHGHARLRRSILHRCYSRVQADSSLSQILAVNLDILELPLPISFLRFDNGSCLLLQCSVAQEPYSMLTRVLYYPDVACCVCQGYDTVMPACFRLS